MKKEVSFWKILQSMFAALLGVQSESNRQRDFNFGKPQHFIVAGIVTTIILILLLKTIATLVI